MSEVLVSVIIPVYNAEKSLSECLDSVLSQSLEQIEVICVDDGSSDNSVAVMEHYAKVDPRVHVEHQSNQYAGVARNRGIGVAKGKYIAFLDADDVMLPRSLEWCYDCAERYKADILKTGFQYQNVKNGRVYQTHYAKVTCLNWFQQHCVLQFEKIPDRLLNVPDVPWNGLYRRAFLLENGIKFNRLRFVNDHSFYIECLLKAQRIVVRRRATVCYRVEQSESLIRKKAEHFDVQLASYELVSEICRDVPKRLNRIIMRQELNSVFHWYNKLKPQATSSERLERQLSAFLHAFDEGLVGADFVRSFPYSGEYYRLRYGAEAPKRPNALKRAMRCWKEHGLAYTLQKMLGKEVE